MPEDTNPSLTFDLPWFVSPFSYTPNPQHLLSQYVYRTRSQPLFPRVQGTPSVRFDNALRPQVNPPFADG